MEALTGLPSKDDWDFVFNGYSNAPFIKTNYPHPAGTWSWGNEADQVALVVQYILRSMVEYADIMWYLSYENTYNKDRVKLEELYGQRDDTDSESSSFSLQLLHYSFDYISNIASFLSRILHLERRPCHAGNLQVRMVH